MGCIVDHGNDGSSVEPAIGWPIPRKRGGTRNLLWQDASDIEQMPSTVGEESKLRIEDPLARSRVVDNNLPIDTHGFGPF